MYSLDRTIDATVEPVTLAQAKTQCRIVTDDDDAYLCVLIKAARQYCEKRTSRAFIQQTWRLSLGCFPVFRRRGVAHLDSYFGVPGWDTGYSSFWRPPSILLPMPNLIGIVSVTYLDATGTRQTLDPSQYGVDYDSQPARIYPAIGTWWPYSAPPQPGAVQVTYTAGYGSTAAAVPATIQLAMLGLIGHWYENREAVVLTNSTDAVTTVPMFVDDLLAGEIVPVFTYEI